MPGPLGLKNKKSNKQKQKSTNKLHPHKQLILRKVYKIIISVMD